MAKVWDEEATSVSLVSLKSYDQMVAPAGVILYNQMIVPEPFYQLVAMSAPKYIFNKNCFLANTAKLALYNSIPESSCSRILRSAHLKGGVNFDPASDLNESQYTSFPSFFRDLTGGELLYQPKNLFDHSNTLWLTNADVKVFYKGL